MKDEILNEYRNGNIVVMTIDGLQICKMEDFIKQPSEGILYDLNRTESVTLTLMDELRWVNDYAVAQTIRALKAKINELEKIANSQ